jgi:hypothetical protein
MVRHGKPPFLECSSRGDRRFSAFFARVRGKSIEQRYQEAKDLGDPEANAVLTWKERRGLPAVNAEECHALYSALWDEYIDANPHLLKVLREASGLSDMFGKPGHACQATELWRIRNECG